MNHLKQGIHLLDDNGQKIVVRNLDDFKFARSLKCVIFCSCESESFAKSVGQYIPYVIAMKEEIRDQFAEAFAGGFSLGLSMGHSIKDSFNLGISRIQMNDLKGDDIPVLYIKGSIYKK